MSLDELPSLKAPHAPLLARDPNQEAGSTLLLIVTVLASVLMGFRAAISYPKPGLDPSYSFALNYAAVHKLSWGQAFVSDRGPFAWLLYPVNVGDIAPLWLVAQAFLAVMIVVAAAAYVWSIPGPRTRRILTGIFLTYSVHLSDWEEYRWFALFLLVFLLGLHRTPRAGLFALGSASLPPGF